MTHYSQVGVKREVLAKILQNEIKRRGGSKVLLTQFHNANKGGYAASLSDEIEASGQMTLYSAKRRIYAILHDEKQELVHFNTADKILTALDLNYLWHTNPELAAAVVEPPRGQPPQFADKALRQVKPCKGCGGSWDVFDPDCQTCTSRKRWREKTSKSALAVRSGLGGLSAGRAPNSSPRGGTTGEGTTFSTQEEAA